MTSGYLTKYLKAGLWVTAIMVSFIFLFGASDVRAQQTSPGTKSGANWSMQAEESFYLNSGMAERLMTQDEWQKYSQKMQGMKADEREEFRREMHSKMMDRAREKGLQVPDVPPEHGKGTTTGKGMDKTLLLAAGAGSGAAGGAATGRAGGLNAPQQDPGTGFTTPNTGIPNQGNMNQDMDTDADRGLQTDQNRNLPSQQNPGLLAPNQNPGLMNNMNTEDLDRGLLLV